MVRSQFISGTHALTVALFAFLRPGDTMLSINGKPYDTLDEVIGIVENKSSLKSYGINFEKIELIEDISKEEINAIKENLKKEEEQIIEKIEKDFGKGSIMKLGDKATVNVDAIPTGALSLDVALGIGNS